LATAADNLVLDPRRSTLGAVPLAGYLARGLSATLVLRLTTIGLSFVTLIVLSRLLGPEGYGQYAYVMATVAILSPLAAAGMPSIVVREVAACRSRGDYARLQGVVVFAFIVGILAFVILLFAYWSFSMAAAAWAAASAGDHLLLVFALLLLATLGGPLSAMQQGLKRIVAAQVPFAVIGPLATLLLLLLAWWTWRRPIDVQDAILLAVLAAAVALAVAVVLTWQAWRQAKPPTRSGYSFEPRAWTAAGFSLALFGALSAVNAQADIVLLRWLAGPEATGIFHVATRNAHLLTLLLGALITPLGPLVAELHAQGERAALQRVVRRSIRVVFLLTLPAALAMIVAGELYLELFGAGFAEAHAALAILALAQLVNVGAGPVQMLLVMTGHQARMIPAMTWSMLANIVLNALLIPSFGATGAACATAFSIVLWNAALSYEVRRHLGIDPGVIGPRLRRPAVAAPGSPRPAHRLPGCER
jgi:O-antigen/teichoic acid export membrane protein